ncbi:histidine phosphatase family protein [Novosphingobium sp. ERN07]|uniref:histidine phosphatase family protein n=1 Tax=Novosphingobium sp. ERN07 TaxID=2726187 RepID=UPI001456AB58|nr:histidine phosphatase family protein [Novosphingobium sp. ERN07]NLR72466.1 histidine phosphatase family protein [Novosphingobium sp. ERN07]
MLVIVRHGNTFNAGEPPRRIGARTDLPLTAEGLAQAQALGELFCAKDWTFARALVSPLLRTRQTAEAILARHPTIIEPADFLREIDHGPDENRAEAEVQARVGKAALDAWDAAGTPPPGWIVNAETRIAAWQALLENLTPNSAPTLLVTSNGAARFALQAMPHLRPASLKLRTGSYGVICREADGTLTLSSWDCRP